MDHPDYERVLTPDEAAIAVERLGEAFGVRSVEDAAAERDAWFGAVEVARSEE